MYNKFIYRYAEKNIKFKVHSSWICVGGEKVGFTLFNPCAPPPSLTSSDIVCQYRF